MEELSPIHDYMPTARVPTCPMIGRSRVNRLRNVKGAVTILKCTPARFNCSMVVAHALVSNTCNLINFEIRNCTSTKKIFYSESTIPIFYCWHITIVKSCNYSFWHMRHMFYTQCRPHPIHVSHLPCFKLYFPSSLSYASHVGVLTGRYPHCWKFTPCSPFVSCRERARLLFLVFFLTSHLPVLFI